MSRTVLLPFALLAAVSSHAAPKRLTTFENVMKHLESGHQVRLVLHYAKLTLTIDGQEEKAPDAIGGMVFSPWEYFAPNVIGNKLAYVVSSETHMIASGRYGYVNNYVRVRIFSDNKVEINARYITMDSKETVMNETFTGFISNGKDKNGVGVFVN